MSYNFEFTIDDDNVKKIFVEDSMYKKLVAHKPIKTKVKEFPSKREINKLSGRVIMSNVYDTIMSHDEFKKLNKLERTKTINEYWKRFSAQEISDAWNRPRRYAHDVHWMLNKDSNSKPSKRDRKKKCETKEENKIDKLKPINIEHPLVIKVIKKLTGEKIQDFILKFIELFDAENKVKINLSIKKISTSNFNFTIEVSDIFELRIFSEEILNTVAAIPKNDLYNVIIEAREIINERICD